MIIKIYEGNKLVTINGFPVNDGGERKKHGGALGPKYDRAKAIKKIMEAVDRALPAKKRP